MSARGLRSREGIGECKTRPPGSSFPCACCGCLPGDQKPIETGHGSSHDFHLKRREPTPVILDMPLHFEVDGQKVLNELWGRWFFHAPTVRHKRPDDKLDERVEALIAILLGYGRSPRPALRSRHAHDTRCKRAWRTAEESYRSMTGIYRIDHHGPRGWRVSLQRQNKIYTRKFSDHRYRGTAEALKAAETYRDSLVGQHPRMSRRAQCEILKRNNRSGVSGVTRSDVVDRRLRVGGPRCIELSDGRGKMGRPRNGASRSNDSANGVRFLRPSRRDATVWSVLRRPSLTISCLKINLPPSVLLTSDQHITLLCAGLNRVG